MLKKICKRIETRKAKKLISKNIVKGITLMNCQPEQTTFLKFNIASTDNDRVLVRKIQVPMSLENNHNLLSLKDIENDYIKESISITSRQILNQAVDCIVEGLLKPSKITF